MPPSTARCPCTLSLRLAETVSAPMAAELGDARREAPRPRLPGGASLVRDDVLVGPPVTGSFAENRAAPDSLAHPGGDTQDWRGRHALVRW